MGFKCSSVDKRCFKYKLLQPKNSNFVLILVKLHNKKWDKNTPKPSEIKKENEKKIEEKIEEKIVE